VDLSAKVELEGGALCVHRTGSFSVQLTLTMLPRFEMARQVAVEFEVEFDATGGCASQNCCWLSVNLREYEK